jgi:hypothetical protein
MRAFSTAAALERHAALASGPVSLRELQKVFDSRPQRSVGALLRTMGPFTQVDGFQFTNSAPLTPEIAGRFAKFAERELVEELTAAALGPYEDVLAGLSVSLPVPFFDDPEFSLPTEVINRTVHGIAVQLAGDLVELVNGPFDSSYGRCGGMAFAAYDFYLAGWPVAAFGATKPAPGTALDEYLLARLIDSLDLNVRKFLEWTMILHVLPALDEVAMSLLLAGVGTIAGPVGSLFGAWIGSHVDLFDLGGASVLLARTTREWPEIKHTLDREAAWPVGLIYGDTASPFSQHQVLAVGYEDRGAGTEVLHIWDNNEAKGKQRGLKLDFSGDSLTVTGELSHDIKGIFLEDYNARRPPWSLKPR